MEPILLNSRLIRQYHLAFWLLAALFVLICYQYGQIIHPFEGPDEPEHFAYITHLIQQGTFPDQEKDFAGAIRQQVGQAPLYYITAAAFGKLGNLDPWHGKPAGNPWWPGGGDFENPTNRNAAMMAEDQHVLDENLHNMADAAQWIRLLSLVYGVMALAGIYWGGLALWQDQRSAVFAALLMAFTPQLLQSFSMISNDVGVIAFSTVVTSGSLHLVKNWRNPHLLFFTGLMMGFAALSKTSGLAIWGVPPVAVIIGFIIDYWERRFIKLDPTPTPPPAGGGNQREGFLNLRTTTFGLGFALVLLIGTAILVCGWWYVRGWLLYRDPLGTKPHTALGWGIDNVPTNAAEISLYVRSMWKPLYADFGWGNLMLPDWGYLLSQVVMLVGMMGWIIGILRYFGNIPSANPTSYPLPMHGEGIQGRGSAWATIGQTLILLLTITIGIAAVAFWLNEISLVPPRLFFPFYSAVLLLLVQGLRQVPWSRLWIAGAAGAMAVIIIPITLIPALGKPALLDTPPTDLDGIQIDFEGAKFLGFTVDNPVIHQGDTRQITLCWQAPDQPYQMHYPFFVKITGIEGEIVAEMGSYTGMGSYTLWEPGKAFCDRFELTITGELQSATAYHIELSLFDQGTGRVFYGSAFDGTPRSNGLIGYLSSPSEMSAQSDDPQQAKFSFDGLHLMDYTVRVEASTLHLNFLWSVSRAPETALKQFIHILDSNGQTVFQFDPLPGGERYPMGTWTAGERMTDQISIPLPELPSGNYEVVMGLYTADALVRLPALDPTDTRLPNDAAAIGEITLP